MSPMDRRQEILEVLRLRRYDTYANLAQEFGVSKETIRHDILALMCSNPIETVRGRHGGGVYMLGNCGSSNGSQKNAALNPRQIALLQELRKSLSGDNLEIMDSILDEFAS